MISEAPVNPFVDPSQQVEEDNHNPDTPEEDPAAPATDAEEGAPAADGAEAAPGTNGAASDDAAQEDGSEETPSKLHPPIPWRQYNTGAKPIMGFAPVLFVVSGQLTRGELQVEVFCTAFGRVLPGDISHIPLDDLVPVVAVGKVQRLGPVDGIQQQAADSYRSKVKPLPSPEKVL